MATRSRSASINELTIAGEDKSLLRAGEFIHLSECLDEVFIANAYRYCQRCLGGSWSKASADKFSVEYLSGGMTNYLYLCSLDKSIATNVHEPRKVLIRIHGNIVDQKQRFYEGVIFTLLSERGYGPKTLGVFYSGRIEEFIPHRHLFTRELADPVISKMVANRAGHYHCFKLPLNKNPSFLWENIEKYLDMCTEVELPDPKTKELYESIKTRFQFEEEYQWLKSTLLKLQSPVVFCHNDLQEGNILFIDDEDGKVQDITLIDYDYSSYNYRAYDIGNHFCEWRYEYTVDDSGDGFIVHKDGYPTKKQQEYFATEYIAELQRFKEKSQQDDYDHQRFTSVIDIPTVESFLYKVDRFTLASDFYWGLWSIVQQQVSKIEFGYMKYAEARFNEYSRKKKEFGY